MVEAAAKFAKAMKKSNLAERILMLAEEEEEDSSDDDDEDDSSDEDEDEGKKDEFEAAAKTPAPKPSSAAKQQKVQKENVAVGSAGKKRDAKPTPATMKKKARTSAGGDKNPFARK